jgi:transcriptional regulator with XRE-family HTH domain
MKKRASIKEIFARNLRENRRKNGFSQEKLAEKIGISTQYLAMIEIARKFPTSTVLERLAKAMNINVYELFLIDHSPRDELEMLRQDFIYEMKQTFGDIIEKAIYSKCKKQKKSSNYRLIRKNSKQILFTKYYYLRQRRIS